MKYLTKSFYSGVCEEQQNNTDKDVKSCVKKLNKWLVKSKQQDVKVDDFSISKEWFNISQYSTRLTIIYHHEN